MTTPPFITRALGKENRAAFDCDNAALNRYFSTQISQDVKRRLAGAFIAFDPVQDKIAGFYTLSATHVALGALDEDWSRKLPRYPTIPAVLVGRLGVDKAYQGQGLGSGLLIDAVSRTLRSDIAAYMLIVDAKDENAAAFYQHHEMRRLIEQKNRLFVPLSSLAKKFGVKSS